MDALYREPPEGYELLAVSALIALGRELYTLVRPRLEASPAADGNLLAVRQMLDCIRTHYPERITLDRIAASGGVCRTQCCRLFRQYLGLTPRLSEFLPPGKGHGAAAVHESLRH